MMGLISINNQPFLTAIKIILQGTMSCTGKRLSDQLVLMITRGKEGDELIRESKVWCLHRKIPVLWVIVEIVLIVGEHIVVDLNQTVQEVYDGLMCLKEGIKLPYICSYWLISVGPENRWIIPQVPRFIRKECDIGIVGSFLGEFASQFTDFLENPNDKACTVIWREPLCVRFGVCGISYTPCLIVKSSVVVPEYVLREVIKLRSYHCANQLKGAILFPVVIINARIDTGRSLVAPERGRGLVANDVCPCTVEKLEELIPLHGQVQACLLATKSDRIMDDVLVC